MKKLFFYKIRVHCWGGLGSQLFAWAMAEQLKIKFPSKDIQIILHNSGVTRRESAIGFLSNKFIITNVNDYALPKNLGTSLSSKDLKLRIFAKSVLDRLGFVIYSSNLKTIAKVRPWTLVLRGHYAHDTVPVSIVHSIIDQVSSHKELRFDKLKSKQDTLGIHYRLGDLLNLDNKTYVHPDTLGKFIVNNVKNYHQKDISVYSDDIAVAKDYLGRYLPQNVQFIDKDIWDTLTELTNQDLFIGTNSKISLWVALFRKSQDPNSYVALPRTMSKELDKILFESCKLDTVDFY
jgi:hypothetical protein